MENFRILFVDDEPVIRECIKEYFLEYSVQTVGDSHSALKELERNYHDILVVDYKMPGMNGFDLLLQARRRNCYYYGILLSAYVDKTLLEEMLNQNLIRKVIEKPLRLESLRYTIDEALSECLKERDRQKELLEMRHLLQSEKLASRIVGLDRGLSTAYSIIKKYALVDENVLITGETGTGKEVVARLIHSLSKRSRFPFVKINCAAIPDSLMESELFGFLKGSFSGAGFDKKGRIETAHQGTLFLDEIGELKPELQTKFLQVIQDKRFEPIGSNKSRDVDFRLISATNRDLEDSIREKDFREDLFFRIGTLPLRIPSLRERREDIPEFCRMIIDQYCREAGRRTLKLAKESMDRLMLHDWPGNVRELENALKRAVILLDPKCDIIFPESFSFLVSVKPDGKDYDPVKHLADRIMSGQTPFSSVESNILKEILRQCHGSIMEAVRCSGIPKDRFYRLDR